MEEKVFFAPKGHRLSFFNKHLFSILSTEICCFNNKNSTTHYYGLYNPL